MQTIDPIVTLFHRGSDEPLGVEIEATLLDAGLTIQRFNSGLAPADQANYCTQFRTRGELEEASIVALEDLCQNAGGVDLVVQPAASFHRPFKLACFDMDSTLIQVEVIDELAKIAGVGTKVAAITASAMRGELDFKASFTARMKLLSGLPEARLSSLVDQLPLMPGAREMMLGLKRRGVRTAILSGGFTYFAEVLQSLLGFDEIHANTLEFQNGVLTGRAVEPIVDGARKAQLLEQIAADRQIPLEQTIAVGDGANDLPMLNLAGLGLAFHAKPKVQAAAKYKLTVPGLDGLLHLFDSGER